MKKEYTVFVLTLFCLACHKTPPSQIQEAKLESDPNPLNTFFTQHPEYIADGFDFPVGKPNAKGYYNAQPFTENNHLGDDWNAVTGGNTDLGDPIYSIANGQVVYAQEAGPGWGKVIRIIHHHPDLPRQYVESLYAHCDSIQVKKGQSVKKGDLIGTIGNADGIYYAHLHLEIRDSIGMPIGGGYNPNTAGYVDPTAFIQTHRELARDSIPLLPRN